MQYARILALIDAEVERLQKLASFWPPPSPLSKRRERENHRLLFFLPLLKLQRFRILPPCSKDPQSRRLSCAKNEQGEPRSRKGLL
jgi:hypothetical protein